jgi:hypothetical protein
MASAQDAMELDLAFKNGRLHEPVPQGQADGWGRRQGAVGAANTRGYARRHSIRQAPFQMAWIAPAQESVIDDQQPRQMDEIIFVTLASSRSIAGLVPSNGPFWAPLPQPLDERAVPSEFVPGAPTRSPKAPPLPMEDEEWCEPMPPPRAKAAAVERPTQTTMQITESFFMPITPRRCNNALIRRTFRP